MPNPVLMLSIQPSPPTPLHLKEALSYKEREKEVSFYWRGEPEDPLRESRFWKPDLVSSGIITRLAMFKAVFDPTDTTLLANDGIEAIAAYAKHKKEIQVVAIDIMMPNMDGITAMRTMQKMNPQVKIIAMSGLSAQKAAAIAAGARIFLSKPYTAQDLLKSLADSIDDRHSSPEARGKS